MKWLLFLVSSCSLLIGPPKTETAKGSLYKIDFKEENWEEDRKVEERSDYVWKNVKDGRILLSNSFCNEFQDQGLDALALKTFKIVSDLKVEQKKFTTFQDREAYLLEGQGSVDGVPVGLKLLNTRRSNCYFDFVSITPLSSTQKPPPAFEKFLAAVKFK